ncbi:hypothetical protein [Streptomyces sp. t39]|uniref:hypothetical protein n=1 Tax=Streptomyces sp. t39 TaxID=1828156 RepID=UPI0011CE772B|nr:hypothetical protein [Streptomyces sp. t39]
MGRHSRKGPVPKGTGTPGAPGTLPGAREAAAPGGGRRRRPGEQHAPAPGPGAPVCQSPQPPPDSWCSGCPPLTGAMPQVRSAPAPAAPGPRIPGPRREFVEAFDGPVPPGEPREPERGGPGPDGGDHEDGGMPPAARGGRGRAFTGVAAAAVTCPRQPGAAGAGPSPASPPRP